MADYATLEDLKKHWPGLPAEREAEATQKLHEATVEVRALFPDVETRLLASTLDDDIPRLVVSRMVKRAMDVATDAATAGLESFQFGTGPFTMGGKVHNPEGNLYLTAADKRLLSSPKPARGAWTIRPGY
jgi:hypothetical protein